MAETLPIFPLGAVMLPGASLPLHIFEPRYRQLTVDLVTGAVPDRRFGIVGVRQGWETGEDGIEETHSIGCSALLRQAERLEDGRFDIVTTGERRFRLLELNIRRAPYLVGTVEWLPDHPIPDAAAESVPLLVNSARGAHRRYCSAAWHGTDWSEPHPDTDPASLAYLIAADCVLPLEDRQDLLEERCPLRRLRLIRRALNREAGIISAWRAVPAPLTEYAHPITLN